VSVDLTTLQLAVRGDRTSASTPPTLHGYGVTGRDLIARLACDASLSVILTDGTTDQHRCTHHHDDDHHGDHHGSTAASTPGSTATSGTPGTTSGAMAGAMAGVPNTAPSAAPSEAAGVSAARGGRTVGRSVLHRCGCPVTPYLHVLDVGRSERLATPRQRLAVLTAQQHRCAAPGCVNTHLEVHHIVSWLDHGPTTMANLVGLCASCHTLLHRGLLRCTADGHGGVVFTRADGSPITDLRRHTLAAYASTVGDLVSASLLTAHQPPQTTTLTPWRQPPRHHTRPPRPERQPRQPREHPPHPEHPDHRGDPATTPPF
jgi:hypothetical protein